MIWKTTLLSGLALCSCMATSQLAAEEAVVVDETAAADAQAVLAFSDLIGRSMGNHVVSNNLDVEAVIAGMKKTIAGEPMPDQMASQAIHKAFMDAQNRAIKPLSDKIIAETDITSSGADWKKAQGLPEAVHDEFYKAFLALPGVQTTPSGLAYQVITEAEGAKPAATNTVSVHYVGRHTSGEIFDSSISRKEPTEFPLNRVIPGWTEGLQLQSEGSTYRFVIPGKLAYGELQEGSQRPTGVLIFDVTLLRIK